MNQAIISLIILFFIYSHNVLLHWSLLTVVSYLYIFYWKLWIYILTSFDLTVISCHVYCNCVDCHLLLVVSSPSWSPFYFILPMSYLFSVGHISYWETLTCSGNLPNRLTLAAWFLNKNYLKVYLQIETNTLYAIDICRCYTSFCALWSMYKVHIHGYSEHQLFL